MISDLRRLAAIPLACFLISAGPTEQVVPHPEIQGEALIIPQNSPVQFRGFDKYGTARFSGSFVLTGTFTYGCEVDCEGPVKESDLAVNLVPDPEVVARLPHWKIYHQDVMIHISHGSDLARAIATRQQRVALRTGKLSELRGRVAIVVDEFATGIECDSVYYSARFVRIAQPPRIAKAELNGDYGCV
jgi:hypothetical protein